MTELWKWVKQMYIRNHVRHLSTALLFLLLLLIATEKTADAYTDPGSGALMWQVLVAAFVGAAFYWRKLLSWFSGRKKGKDGERQSGAEK
jgi:hypothetical protein